VSRKKGDLRKRSGGNRLRKDPTTGSAVIKKKKGKKGVSESANPKAGEGDGRGNARPTGKNYNKGMFEGKEKISGLTND